VPPGLSTTAANALLSSLAATYTWIQLHLGQPGANGTANLAVETTRKQATWAAPSGGLLTNSAELLWTAVAASEDYAFFTAWTVSSGGTFGFSGTVTADAVTVGNNFRAPVGALDVTLVLAS